MTRPRPPWRTAVFGSAVGMSAAAVVNGVLTLVAGSTVRVPGELGPAHVVAFTLAAAPVLAVLLRAVLPARIVPVLVVATAATLPFPYLEFGLSTATWLAAMHLVAAFAALGAAWWVRR